eukprot:COSAG02_NODE_1627_length_11587_cov_2.478238_6_plen_193_part_00
MKFPRTQLVNSRVLGVRRGIELVRPVIGLGCCDADGGARGRCPPALERCAAAAGGGRAGAVGSGGILAAAPTLIRRRREVYIRTPPAAHLGTPPAAHVRGRRQPPPPAAHVRGRRQRALPAAHVGYCHHWRIHVSRPVPLAVAVRSRWIAPFPAPGRASPTSVPSGGNLTAGGTPASSASSAAPASSAARNN